MVTLLTKPINIKKNLAEGASLFFFVGSLIFTKSPEVYGLEPNKKLDIESEQITSELNTIKPKIGHLLYAQGETQKTLTQLNKKIKDLEKEAQTLRGDVAKPRLTNDQLKEIELAKIKADFYKDLTIPITIILVSLVFTGGHLLSKFLSLCVIKE